MEYVRGITLRTLLQETGTLPFSAGLRIARQLCRGLAAAHAVGVLHRDIKPENLVVEATGNAKLMDFGIARPVRRKVEEGATEAGMVIGTPHYLAPEQIQGREDLDERADLFAVGVVFYEIFTGHLPSEGKSPTEIMVATLREEPPAPRTWNPGLPALLEELILRCLAKERERRPRTADELLESLSTLRA
jgi:serine/threonine-protein kinase